ncbi:MAG: hypothetical protein LBD37_07500 [Treponema sp.]|jgi:hypothetical protein|nr:hypothetical protein [Treponema sp.]
MQKRRKAQDVLVTLFCLTGAAVSLYLFFLDLNQTLRGLTEQPAGLIFFKNNTAQRRLANRVIWDRLRQGSPVYPGDMIRTAELSDAEIHLSGGDGQSASGKIMLAENTLIQIRIGRDGMEIDLAEGDIGFSSFGAGADDSAALVLTLGGSRIQLAQNSALNARTGGGGEGPVIQVIQGSAAVSSAEGVQDLAAGGLMAVDAGGAARGEPVVAVAAPQPGALFLQAKREAVEVPFSWRRINLAPDEPLALEFSNDRRFSRIAQTLIVSDDDARVALPLGNWYWRIGSFASGRVRVIYAPPPVLLTPAEGYGYRYRTRQPGVWFQWTQTEGAAGYILEAAASPDFAAPALAVQTGGSSLVSSQLGAGTWYWRVRPVFPGIYTGSVEASQTGSFRITQSGVLNAPGLLVPGAGGRITIAEDRGDCYFSWRSEVEAASYTIRIAANQDLRDPVISQTVRDNYYNYRKEERVLQAGRYYWGVFQTDSEGNVSPVSASRSFTALREAAVQRAIFPPDNYTIAESLLPEIAFTWKSNAPFEIRFQIAAEKDFARPVVDEPVTGESFRGRPLPPGTWYWRISAQGPASGEDAAADLGLQTPAKRFRVVPALPVPAMEQPGPGDQIVITGAEAAKFRWTPVEGAEYYRFRMYADMNHERLVYEQWNKEAALSVPVDNLEEGDYYWTLQADASERAAATRRTGQMGGGRFSLRKLTVLRLDAPENGAEIPGLRALREPTMLRWSTQEAVGRSRFILSRNPDPAAGRPVLEMPNPNRTVVLNRLAQGLYYWTIRAESADGLDISPKSPGYFRVLPIPLLPEAAERLPAHGYRIGPEEAREGRHIRFSWKAVAGANGYIFTLYREQDDGLRQIIRQGPEPRTSYFLEDIQRINRGNFVWQVEAVNLGRNGMVEQRGRPGKNQFQVDIPLPNRVQTEEPGILYGK